MDGTPGNDALRLSEVIWSHVKGRA